MPKRRSSKAKSTSNQDDQLLEHLKRYYDFKEFDPHKLPLNLPTKFPLRLGPKTVGLCSVEWNHVVIPMLSASMRTSKPVEQSEAEYLQHVSDMWEAASRETQNAILEPFQHMLRYICEFLPTKFDDSLRQLSGEAFFYAAAMMRRDEADSKPQFSRTRVADKILKREREAILSRLPRAKRFSSKTKPAWKDDATLMQYATLVGRRALLVRFIKEVYAACDGAEGWTEDLEENVDFQLLKTGIPKKPMNGAIKRVAITKGKGREGEPVSIACEMARQELDLPVQKPQTLRTYYTKGLGLLKKDRNRQKLIH